MTKIGMSAAGWLAAVLLSGPMMADAEPFAYVTNAFGPSVSVVDTATNEVTATVAFPAGSVPFAAAITPDLKKVYVTSLDALSTCGNTVVFVIDTASNALGPGPAAVGCEPIGIAVTPDGRYAYVASRFSGTVSVIDTATNAVRTTITLPSGSWLAGIAISPDGQRAYLTAGGVQDVVIVIDTSSNTVLDTIIGVGGSPWGIAVSPDGGLVFVTNNHTSGTVTVIDAATKTVVATIAVGQYPSAVAFTPDGTMAYVTNGGISDGVFTVSVIDTAAYAVVGSPITVGSFPNSIAITADGKQVYVGNEGGNTVSVIDTASNVVTTTIGGMNSPRGVAARPIPPGVPVPNVVGQTQAAASAAIETAGLTVGIITRRSSNTIPSGSVISQSPAAGTRVAGGTAVNLVVSRGHKSGGGDMDLLTILGLVMVLTLAYRPHRTIS